METIVDWQASRDYHDRLNAYLTKRVLDSGSQFSCSEADACSRSAARAGLGFAGGQLSYVGDAYACSVGGQPLRVLVASMQVGDAEAPVTMARRTQQILTRVPERPGQRNPHMRGVTRALQVLFGLSVHRERQPGDELLADGTHVLRAYAMANSTLCSALPTGGRSRRGKPTDTMLRRCGQHLVATLRELEPTVVQVQGSDTRVAFERVATTLDQVTDTVSVVEVDGRRMVSCATSHPAAGPPSSWSSLKPGSYFNETVMPSLELARRLAIDAP